MDINSSGLHFTWNQKPKGGCGLLKKLDRIMGNTEFIDAFPGAYALFQPYRISDHSPAVLNIPNLPFNKPKPFKFFNFLAHKSQFRELLSSVWSVNVDGEKSQGQRRWIVLERVKRRKTTRELSWVSFGRESLFLGIRGKVWGVDTLGPSMIYVLLHS
ncbi:hypothetical protein Tco_0128406 [Tanacetum coccineum]